MKLYSEGRVIVDQKGGIHGTKPKLENYLYNAFCKICGSQTAAAEDSNLNIPAAVHVTVKHILSYINTHEPFKDSV